MHDPDSYLRDLLAKQQAERDALPEHWHCAEHGPYPTLTADRQQQSSVCPACDVKAKADRAAWEDQVRAWSFLQATDIPPLYGNRVFGNHKGNTREQRTARATVRAWLEQDQLPILLMVGPVGVGKTHLCTAAVTHTALRFRRSLYVYVPDLLSNLRSSYRDGAEDSPDDVLAPIERAHLVALDDIGATRGTDWEREQLGQLIDRTYRGEGPALILSSNATVAELPTWIGDRAADRLNECAQVLVMSGPSQRATLGRDPAVRDAPPPMTDPGRSLRLTRTVRGELKHYKVEFYGWRDGGFQEHEARRSEA